MSDFNVIGELEVLEVSSVDKPANLRKFALFKKLEATVEKQKEPEAQPEVLEKAEKAALDKALAEKATLEKSLAEALAKLNAAEDAKAEALYLSKAAEFSAVPMQKNDLVTLLKSTAGTELEGMVQELLTTVQAALLAKETQVAEGELMKSLGVGSDVEPMTGYQELTKAAQMRIVADPSLTIEQAKDRIMQERPELYDRIKREG